MANPNHPAAPYQAGEGSPPTPRAPAPEQYAGGVDAMEVLAARLSQALQLRGTSGRPDLFPEGSIYHLMPQPRAVLLPRGAEQHRLLPPRPLQHHLLPQGAPIEQQHHLLPQGAPIEQQHHLLPQGAPIEQQHHLLPQGAPIEEQPRLLPPRAPIELQHRFLAPRFIDSTTRGESSQRQPDWYARPISPSTPHFASGSNAPVQDSGSGRQGQVEEMLNRVKFDVHEAMGTEHGSLEFRMLLDCFEGDNHHLRGLVHSFVERDKPVWGRWLRRRPVDDTDYIWLASVENLLKTVSQYPDLCREIIHCLLRENVTCNARGPELLEICFGTMPYQETKALIQHAVSDIEKNMHRSRFGSLCLAMCSTYAKGDESESLEESIINGIRDMCLGKYSNYLVQHVTEHGSDEFLCSVLSLFIHLEAAQLAELVNGEFSNFASQKLLDTGSACLPATTQMLAQKIQQLPAVVLTHPNARLVASQGGPQSLKQSKL